MFRTTKNSALGIKTQELEFDNDVLNQNMHLRNQINIEGNWGTLNIPAGKIRVHLRGITTPQNRILLSLIHDEILLGGSSQLVSG